jgi:oligoendopeptidase F
MKKSNLIPLVNVLLVIVLLFPAQLVQAQERSQDRVNIPAEYKWNFNDIYPNWQEWEKDLNRLGQKMKEVSALKGTLGKKPENLLKALKLQDELTMTAYKVYRYPQLMRDTDTRNQEVSGRLQQVGILFAQFNVATSWINPELLKIPWETMKKWLHSSEDFAPYRFQLSDLYRQQAHVLDEEKENLLAFYTRFRGAPNSIYTELSTSDVKFPKVKMADGKDIQATSGNYSKVLATSLNRDDRKKIFEAHYGVYNEYINTYTAIYQSVCQRDWAAAQSRNYKSTLEASLDSYNVPLEVYENLVKTVKENTAPLQRYAKLRAKALNLKDYSSYDGSIPIVDFKKTYPYDQAKQWALESVAPLGKDYQAKLKKAISAGWIDVYENTGKRSGAYSANVYGVHPFMLMNYNDTLRSVFTLAHELGHTLHSQFSSENQPFATHSYTLFVAEVASTFNERLLLDYLLKRTKDPKERITLLEQAIKGITGTFYFQVLLADFELQVHRLVEQGKPITAKVLNTIMDKLFKAYYGDSVTEHELLKVVWARIPHIYRTPYYVYQYATCFASSAQIYDRVNKGPKKQREAALDSYLDLLESGGNDYPMAQLKKAGVDLANPETIKAVIRQMDQLVSQLEKEINTLQKKN